MVFSYLDIFDPNAEEVAALKEHYRAGGLGDVKLKRRLIDVLNTLITPIRERRAQYAQDPQAVMAIALAGSEKVREVAAKTMDEVRRAMHLNYK